MLDRLVYYVPRVVVLRLLRDIIALFVCLSTKAIHLELVDDLTTASLLGALNRFVGRRGRPQEIWSDNGSNFWGADAELHRLLREAEVDCGLLEGQLAKAGITWRLIPPVAPHFGGIWEAGVKSTKAHLRWILGPRKLTCEELSTLLVEIEMILNCRPLTLLSGDCKEIEALTPAHFLTSALLTSAPRPDAADKNLNHVTHWRLVNALRDQFWTRWSREYLNTLQQRGKWLRPRSNLLPGNLVIILDPSLLKPNGKWPLGRILQTHPGPDGLVRVATVRMGYGLYTRPVVKLARLPINSTEPAPDGANCELNA